MRPDSMKPKSSQSSYKWCFALHNWTPTDWAYLNKVCHADNCIRYCYASQETGKQDETPHLQGCVIFVTTFKTTANNASNVLMGPNKDIKNSGAETKGHCCHMTAMRGSAEQNVVHCSKEAGCVTFECGDPPKSEQGKGFPPIQCPSLNHNHFPRQWANARIRRKC